MPDLGQSERWLVCPKCLADGRAQPLTYDFRRNLWTCPLHVWVLTGEWLAQELPTGGRS